MDDVVKELFKDMLKELQYQTKLLESLVSNQGGGTVDEKMEKAMNLVLNNPMFKNMGLDKDKIMQMMQHANIKKG